MDQQALQEKFVRIGARVNVTNGFSRRQLMRTEGNFLLDVQKDDKGEFFAVRLRPRAAVDLDVVDLRPRDRHLLLMVRENGEKQKFLCGHDERHWFVAAIPESASGVSSVLSAMEALKPAEVKQAQARKELRGKDIRRRKNAAYLRQGEWFFLPAPGLKVDPKLILRNEPMSRGAGSKPHYAEFCYRTGGETVYVCSKHPNGVREREYRQILAREPKAKKWGWRVMRRNAEVYVKGQVRHSDHKSIGLHSWHRVLMNTENQSRAMRNVVFLD